MDNQIRNGFPVVRRMDVINSMDVATSELDPVEALFTAIEQLAEPGSVVAHLAKHGRSIVQMVSNDLDVLRETAEKAGLAGELMPEVNHGSQGRL